MLNIKPGMKVKCIKHYDERWLVGKFYIVYDILYDINDKISTIIVDSERDKVRVGEGGIKELVSKDTLDKHPKWGWLSFNVVKQRNLPEWF